MSKEIFEIVKSCENCVGCNMPLIKKDTDIDCEYWECSEKYEGNILDNIPWYLRQAYLYDSLDIDGIKFGLECLKNEGYIVLSVYNIVHYVLKINTKELSEILGVKTKVLIEEMPKKNKSKYAKQFSEILNVPLKYFERTTTNDIEDIKELLLEKYEVKKKPKNKKIKKKKR